MLFGAMASVRADALPPQSLLGQYASAGAYADCWTADVPRSVSLAQYVEAFYTGGVFKVERLLLRLFLSMPSTDEQARQLAAGALSTFSAWRVEERSATELLMRAAGRNPLRRGSGSQWVTRPAGARASSLELQF